jgi:hypothetical protein
VLRTAKGHEWLDPFVDVESRNWLHLDCLYAAVEERPDSAVTNSSCNSERST